MSLRSIMSAMAANSNFDSCKELENFTFTFDEMTCRKQSCMAKSFL